MKKIAFSFATLLVACGLSMGAIAQSTSSGATTSASDTDHAHPFRNLDHFLDHHPQVRKELNHNPRLANDPAFLQKHPHFANFLAHHPHVKQGLARHPYRFARRERHFERRENRRENRREHHAGRRK